jgi:endonuclease/exonuclease/phosphatase (EEP) superfamily protein YafD
VVRLAPDPARGCGDDRLQCGSVNQPAPEAAVADDGHTDAPATGAAQRATPPRWVGPVVVGLLTALTLLRWVDSAAPAVITTFQAVVPALVVPVALTVAVAAIARRWRTAMAAAALLAFHVVLLAPWWIADRPSGALDGAPLTVMATNLQYGRGDAGTVVRAVTDHEVDVAVVIEATPASREALRNAGVERLLPHVVGTAREDASGTLVYSRYPLSDRDVPALPSLTFGHVAVRVDAPGGEVLVLGAHPTPPWPIDTARWRAETSALADWIGRVPGDLPLVVAGDLNGSIDHPATRSFLASGMVDAHEAAGAGLPRTWPYDRGLLDTPPLLHLDHVLARDLHPVAAGMVVVPGSDHAAVWARMQRTRR